MKIRETPLHPTFWLKVCCTFGLYLLIWRSRYLEVTGQRLVYHAGLLGKSERTVVLSKVLDISIQQGILGRVLGYGDIAIETAAGPLAEFAFRNVRSPNKFRETILKRQEG